MKYRFENVICTRVIDGDTIVAVIDYGFGLTQKHHFRLSRINAPEIRGKERPKGLKSKKWLKELIEGKPIILESFKGDKYGRYLADVYPKNVPTMCINDLLVVNKLAKYKKY